MDFLPIKPVIAVRPFFQRKDPHDVEPPSLEKVFAT